MFYEHFRFKIEFKRGHEREVDEALDDHFSGSPNVRITRSRPRRVYVRGDSEMVLVKLRLHSSIMRVVDSND